MPRRRTKPGDLITDKYVWYIVAAGHAKQRFVCLSYPDFTFTHPEHMTLRASMWNHDYQLTDADRLYIMKETLAAVV